jgi:hypothetical protein
MSWERKENPTPYDNQRIPGLFFLDGDVRARVQQDESQWTRGMKRAMIAFPSGVECSLMKGGQGERGPLVHLFGRMELPLYSSRDEAFELAAAIAEAHGHTVQKRGESSLEVTRFESDQQYRITYDDRIHLLVDVTPLQERGENTPQPVPDVVPDIPPPDEWHPLKARILEQWQRLPPQEQTAVLAEQLRDLLEEGDPVRVTLTITPERAESTPRRAGEPIPVSWVSKQDLVHCRPDLAGEITALSEADVEYIAEKVGDGLQDSYRLAVEVAIEDYFGIADPQDDD